MKQEHQCVIEGCENLTTNPKYCSKYCAGKAFGENNKGKTAWNKGKKCPHKLGCSCNSCKTKQGKPHKFDCTCIGCSPNTYTSPGEEHPHYKGDDAVYSGYTREFIEDNSFQEEIRNRAGGRCEVCDRSDEDSPKRFDRHHLDEDIKNDDACNIMYICHSCHMTLHWRLKKQQVSI